MVVIVWSYNLERLFEPKRRPVYRQAVHPGRSITIVLGMHRSGTSLCSHVLSAMGVHMADSVSPSHENPKGFWEQWEIVSIHDRLLGHFGLDWTTPHRLPTAWWADPFVRDRKEELKAFLTERLHSSAHLGFKDPRTAALLPMWYEILDELGLKANFVFCMRRPENVAQSLVTRGGIDAGDRPNLIWLFYNLSIVYHLGTRPYALIDYDRWHETPHDNIERLASQIYGRTGVDQHIADAIGAIVDPGLRRSTATRHPSRIARKLYEGAIRAADASQDGADLRRWAGEMLDVIALVGSGQTRDAPPCDPGVDALRMDIERLREENGRLREQVDRAERAAHADAALSASGSLGSSSATSVDEGADAMPA